MKKITLLFSMFIIMTCFLGFKIIASSNLQRQQNTKLYENKTYNVLLQYNKDWKLNTNYTERYEGKNGFFQISALTGENKKIDEVVNSEINHILKPYGSNPRITKEIIKGQEARLIMPSNDQNKEFKNQAELIVKYPKPIKINNETYYYFILWADKNNIQEISKTIKFLS